MLRLAIRNLLRHRRRSLLTAGGVAVATALIVWSLAYMNTFIVAMVQGATATELGQVQVHTERWTDQPSIFASFETGGDALLDLVEGVEGVERADAAHPQLRPRRHRERTRAEHASSVSLPSARRASRAWQTG